tara:strand:- start:963 stop:1160 length:198 start_codon:yes stop_codon:yes gene_type:complete
MPSYKLDRLKAKIRASRDLTECKERLIKAHEEIDHLKDQLEIVIKERNTWKEKAEGMTRSKHGGF